jgi:uridine kinase
MSLQFHLLKAKREAKHFKTCPNCIPPRIIGIAGGTRSGKSTLSKTLISTEFKGCSVIHFDGFFKLEENIPVDEKTGMKNWDSPDSLEIEAYIEFVNCQKHLHFAQCGDCSGDGVRKKKRTLFLEGFLLYYFDELNEICDEKLFVFVDKKTTMERRSNTMNTSLEYFENIIWPSYLLHNSKLKEATDVFFICGDRDKNEVVRIAVDYLQGKEIKSEKEEFLISFKNDYFWI